jgi:hypothetical protein
VAGGEIHFVTSHPPVCEQLHAHMKAATVPAILYLEGGLLLTDGGQNLC